MGSLVSLLVIDGVVTILLLQDVLQDLDHDRDETLVVTTTSTALQGRLIEMQAGLETGIALGDADWITLKAKINETQTDLDRLRQLDVSRHEAADIVNTLDERQSRMASLMTQFDATDAAGRSPRLAELKQVNSDMRDRLANFDQALRVHSERQQQQTTTKFRWVALGLGLTFLVMINISVMVFTRLSGMILQPIDRLLEASRRLANDEYDYRVYLGRNDEFDELARSYNNLAAQMQANELRKIETLHQVARTLNHELNNAIAIIQMQLRLLARTADANGAQAERWQEIHQTLSRMSATVKDLTRVRRIVLTDYLAGVKMLDLKRSVDAEETVSS